MNTKKWANILKYIMSAVYPAIGIYLLLKKGTISSDRKIEIIISLLLIAYGIYRLAMSWNKMQADKRGEDPIQ